MDGRSRAEFNPLRTAVQCRFTRISEHLQLEGPFSARPVNVLCKATQSDSLRMVKQ